MELTTQQKSDLETLYQIADRVCEIYGMVKKLADRYNFPKTNKAGFFSDCTDLNSNIFLLCNWIVSPSAETFLPFIQSRHNAAFCTLSTYLQDHDN